MPRSVSRGILNKLFLLAIGIIIGCVAIEFGLRAVFALKVGPDILLYGTGYCCGPSKRMAFDPRGGNEILYKTAHTVGDPEMVRKSYRKYSPNQTRRDFSAQGNPFDVRINNHGFRGGDFSIRKKKDVIRVLTLGGSSTFGYRSPDHQTYPAYMETLLNQWLTENKIQSVESFEVINLGIPHLWTGMIQSLYESEGVPLTPDFVTLYAGMNDAKPAFRYRIRPNEYKFDNTTRKDKPELVKVLYEFIIVDLSNYLISIAWIQNMITTSRTMYSVDSFDGYSRHKSEDFIQNIAAINDMTRYIGSIFIVANQAGHHSDHQLPVRGVSYWNEVDRLRKAHFQEGRDMNLRQMSFLAHSMIMERLECWCNDNSVPFVDVINALDSRRDLMTSYVHLTPEANHIVAEAFAKKIWDRAVTFGETVKQ